MDTLRFIDYERKTNLQTSRGRSSPSHNQLVSLLKQLDQKPTDCRLLVEAAEHCIVLDDIATCLELVKRALQSDPSHEQAKLIYADASLKMEKLDDYPPSPPEQVRYANHGRV